MKKTFRSILAGALALLAVSCYDDSGLRDDIKKLDERVTAIENVLNAEVNGINDLATRLAAAEQALATANTTVTELVSQLDAVDGKVDGKVADFEAAIATLTEADKTLDDKIVAAIAKIAVVDVEEKDGKVVLTLADNTTVALSKPLANVDNTNLVTITDENMWAVVNADGTVTSLDIPVGHPDVAVEFQVSSTGELQYSVNGGNWEDTGVNTSDISGQKYVINDVILYDEEKCVVITIGDVEYTLPLYSTDSSVLAIKSGKTYFSYGEEKTVDIVLSEISSMYVMSKPDGWKAKLSGKKLTVTAPLEANVLSGASEADGEVLLHCTTAEGKCKIASLTVATTPGFSLTLAEDGTLTITNPEVITMTDRDGNTITDFNEALVGLAPIADFEADPISYVAGVQDDYDALYYNIDSWKMNTADMDEDWNIVYTIGGEYTPGEYEIDVIETTVPQMYSDWTWGEEIPATPFVVWACPLDEKGMPRTADLVYAYYYPSVKATITEVAASTTDVEVAISVVGTDHYCVGLVTEEMLYGFPIDQYMQMSEGPFGSFQQYLQWRPDYALQPMGTEFGGEFGEQMPETITASMLNYGQPLMPNTKFYMWVFPVVVGVELADYTYEKNLKPYIYEFTTAGLSAGGSATVEFGDEILTFSSMQVELSSEGASMVYYNWFTPAAYEAFADDAALSQDLLNKGYVCAGEAGMAVTNSQDHTVSPGAEFYLVALAVDAEGKYGEVASKLYAAPELKFSETFKASFGEPAPTVWFSGYKYDFPITVEGGDAAKYYYVWSTTEFSDEQLAKLPLGSSAENDYSFKNTTNVAAGKLAGQYGNASTTYYLAVVVESTAGEFSPVIKMTVEVPAAAEAE